MLLERYGAAAGVPPALAARARTIVPRREFGATPEPK
jgi:hypothetical protein